MEGIDKADDFLLASGLAGQFDGSLIGLCPTIAEKGQVIIGPNQFYSHFFLEAALIEVGTVPDSIHLLGQGSLDLRMKAQIGHPNSR